MLPMLIDLTPQFTPLLYATVVLFSVSGIGILLSGPSMLLHLQRRARRLQRRAKGKPLRVVTQQA